MDIKKYLLEEKNSIMSQLKRLKSDYQKQKSKTEGDSLACNKSNGVPQYFINGMYISKREISRCEAIAQRDYEEKAIEYLTRKLKYIEKIIPFETESVDAVYSSLCDGRKRLVKPIVEPEDEFVARWISEQYEPNGYWEDNKTEYYTRLGERVRSKAEKIIADELTAYNVPYHYEYPLYVMDGNQQKLLRPDFKALNRRTREEFYLEHLGMMDKAGYNNVNLNKLDLLERNGFLLGVNLLVFHETAESPLSISVVRRYIEEYLV